MNWAMRYTFHAGYEPPALRAQFVETLGTQDPVAHIRYAAEQGVAGILYPWALDRPEREVAEVAAALAETELSGSCMISAPSSLVFSNLWTDRSATGRARLETVTLQACQLAKRLRVKVLAAFIVAEAGRDEDQQRDDAAASLTEMAALTEDHEIALGLEPLALPGLMLKSVGATLDLIRHVNHRNLGIIYDTGHVATLEGALMPALTESLDHLVLAQFADLPGRVEPGAGELDLVEVAVALCQHGYTGLVDLEHGWLSPGKDGEADGMSRLRAFDGQIRAAIAEGQSAASPSSAAG